MSFSTILLVAGLLTADATDTLETAIVVADKGVIVSHSDTVFISNQINVTEALSNIPALFVGDMGGSAGLKTVNLRGLGSAHTAVYVDGVRVNNVQSGQTDLGMLDIGNCSGIVVDYAQNSLSFNTARPRFESGNFAGNVKFRSGSFGTYEPSVRLDFRLSDKVSLSATSSGTISKGNFKYGENCRRDNNDISQIRAGVDIWGLIDKGSWHTKAYFNGAGRGAPGSTDWPSTDRQKDRNLFVQSVVHNRFSSLYTLNASARIAYDDLVYLSEWGDSRYQATDFQLNTSHIFHIASWVELSVAADLQQDKLKASEYEAARTGILSTATATFRLPRFKANVSLEYSGTFDKGYKGRNAVSPSADLRYTVVNGLDIVAFGRRAYRIPTFNELFYPGYGNPDLKCEDAWLSTIGAHLRKHISNWKVNAGADFYCNSIKDKIISAPSPENPSLWLPFNIGKALMYGTDIRTGAGFTKGDWTGALSAAYTWQNAKDKTPDSASFDEQIPFISKHSLNVTLNSSYRGWSIDLLWNLRCGRRDNYSEMPDYNTLDITLGKNIPFRSGHSLGLKFLTRNITDTRYELSSGYPMPGRSFFGSIDFNF